MRRILFWMHLGAGVVAGVLIVFFSVTGALLAYERPIVHAADQRSYAADPVLPNTVPIPLDELLARAAAALPAPVDAVTLYQDVHAPVEIETASRDVYFVDSALRPSAGSCVAAPSRVLCRGHGVAPLVRVEQRAPRRRNRRKGRGRLVVALSACLRRLPLAAASLEQHRTARRHGASSPCARARTQLQLAQSYRFLDRSAAGDRRHDRCDHGLPMRPTRCSSVWPAARCRSAAGTERRAVMMLRNTPCPRISTRPLPRRRAM